jgi:hypothetical protein
MFDIVLGNVLIILFVTLVSAIKGSYMHSFMQRLENRNIFPFLKKVSTNG